MVSSGCMIHFVHIHDSVLEYYPEMNSDICVVSIWDHILVNVWTLLEHIGYQNLNHSKLSSQIMHFL